MVGAGHSARMIFRLWRAPIGLLGGILWAVLAGMLVACIPQVVVTQPQLLLRVHNHPGTPIHTVDFSGGEINGVYEVDEVAESPTE